MFEIGLAVFVIYLFFHWADELFFHSARVPARSERMLDLGNLIFFMACVSMVIWIEYSEKTRIYFGLTAVGSVVLATLGEFSYSKVQEGRTSAKENWLHSWIYIVHPFALVALGSIWPFINGVNFFLNIVLPFSTKFLHSLCLGYLVALSILFLFRLGRWAFKRNHQTDILPS